MLKKVGLGLLAVLLVLVVVIATRPSEFKLERATTIAAPPDMVFGLVNDFHQWTHWSPWEKLDPNMKKTFEGPAFGVGSVYAWAGNDQVGEGRMTLTESRPSEHVAIKLEFLKPWAATNTTLFAFKAASGGTQVTWAMQGTNGFVSKAFSMFMDMDKMVGGDFEKGLAAMKAKAEGDAQKVAVGN